MNENYNSRYIVYNITNKSNANAQIHSYQDIFDLYSLLLNSSEVISIEEYQTDDGLHNELRVVFWNESSYNLFAEKNQKEYQALVNRLHQNYKTNSAEFLRFTSTDNYKSKFPLKYYPNATNLINWTMIPLFKKWFIDNIIPLGKVREYLGEGKFLEKDITGSRFLKQRTSKIERLPMSKKAKEGFPNVLNFDFDHALEYAINKQNFIYNRLIKLSRTVETQAEEYIENCEHSAVLIGHKSLGDEITVHTHRLSDGKKLTLTFVVRLTCDDLPVTYKFYQPLSDSNSKISYYYSHPKFVERYARNKQAYEITSDARSSVLIFDAGYIPHGVTYSDDIYLYFVYDNVTFKPNVLEQLKLKSKKVEIENLYFFDL